MKHELCSLPLVAMGAFWSLDFAGNLIMSRRGHIYLLIMVDHSTKWVGNKASETVASLQGHRAIWGVQGGAHRSRQGISGDVRGPPGCPGHPAPALLPLQPPDQWPCGEDGEHPKEGAAEVCRGARSPDSDRQLPWLLMGYRFSTQAALGVVSPFELVHVRNALLRGQHPPPAWTAPLPDDLDDPGA